MLFKLAPGKYVSPYSIKSIIAADEIEATSYSARCSPRVLINHSEGYVEMIRCATMEATEALAEDIARRLEEALKPAPLVDRPSPTTSGDLLSLCKGLHPTAYDDTTVYAFLGTLTIGEADHHVEIIRVMEGDIVEPPDEAPPEVKDKFDDMQKFYDGAYRTFKFPGHDGRYIMFVYPFAD